MMISRCGALIAGLPISRVPKIRRESLLKKEKENTRQPPK
jgi:hypothetical protein